jgi:Domain of unknown function (DUF4314)
VEDRKCVVCGKKLPANGHKANLCESCYDQAVRDITEHKDPDLEDEASAFRNLVGRRIRLLHTDDPYTRLHYGSLGTIHDITSTPWGDVQVWCKWDEGSSLALIAGKDSFEFV